MIKTKTHNNSKQTIKFFKNHYPNAHCALNYETPFQLLVATILSAQCTDERVNKVTSELFKKYSTAFEIAKLGHKKSGQKELESLIRSTGFYKNKAKNLIGSAQILNNQYQGKLPQTIEELIHLPGVGRKTANVVLGNAYGIISGIVVDTHVIRLSGRLGWTKSKNAVVIEQELQEIIPKKYWIKISHWLITHGRQICKARKPQCQKCFLSEICPKIL